MTVTTFHCWLGDSWVLFDSKELHKRKTNYLVQLWIMHLLQHQLKVNTQSLGSVRLCFLSVLMDMLIGYYIAHLSSSLLVFQQPQHKFNMPIILSILPVDAMVISGWCGWMDELCGTSSWLFLSWSLSLCWQVLVYITFDKGMYCTKIFYLSVFTGVLKFYSGS